jgi:uncharacterized DUF497 family protein
LVVVNGLVWDEWNRKHLARHNISPEEVEEICHRKNKIIDSYRRRIMIIGTTKAGRKLAVVLSPEDKNLQPYGNGIYYVITAFEKEIKI